MAEPTRARAAIVVLAAGTGSRVGAEVNKVLLPLDGRPVVAWSVRDALDTPGVSRVLLVVREGHERSVAEVLDQAGVVDPRVEYAVGGATRHDSEWAALLVLEPAIAAGEIDVVAIHDAARPRAGVALFASVIARAREHGGAVPVVDLVDVAPRDGTALTARLAAVQTPQAFRAGALLEAYRSAEADAFVGTDTSSCMEHYAADVRIAAVAGDPANLKITFAGDFARATGG